MTQYRKTFIGETEVDFESIRRGDKFILREVDGFMLGLFIAKSDPLFSNGVAGIKCEPIEIKLRI